MRAHTVVFKHALRNAVVPILTVVGVTTGVLLSGAVVIETVFSLLLTPKCIHCDAKDQS
jgi:peptide/nickel transport system permease protein